MTRQEDKLLKALDSAFGQAIGIVTKPVTLLTDRFNLLLKGLEAKAFNKETVADVDGFVEGLIGELQNAEKSLVPFFGEIVFLHNLAEKMATLENELELLDILGERIQRFIKTDMVVAWLWNAKEEILVPGYKKVPKGISLTTEFQPWAEKLFAKSEAKLFENKVLGKKRYNILAVPLKSITEPFGILFVGKKRHNGTFTTEESTLVIAGVTMVSFALSNFKINQKFQKNQKLALLGQTIGGISHDIKNILNNLENGIAMVDIGLKDKKLDLVKTGNVVLGRSYQRMKELVLSMVDYSKDRSPDYELTDINQLVKEIVQVNRQLYNDPSIYWEMKFDKKTPNIYIDPRQIDRLLSNLLTNAIDALKKEGGIITTRTQYDDEAKIVSLSVEDNGIGIPPKALESIFELFYSTKGSGGTGFGLAIAQKIVNEHDGSIEVSSVPDKGSKFTIKLPAKTSLSQENKKR
ncbi:MAG: HAMP domain-containing sensor histidine kinase [Candidatus Ratteibacteria bacterium]|jgi:signal transduction histidine kinase